jgi:hypothetical protein
VANVPDRTGVLIIRAWTEGENPSVIIRITATFDVLAGEPMKTTVTTISEACLIVEEWLANFASDASGEKPAG